ncbi:MAG: EVE domain-containing protein [Micrococcaceae bacterium]
MPKYWINTVSKDHVLRGVAGGFTQANHGKPHMLRKMEQGDWLIFYSPKTHIKAGEPVQAFTAIGQITDTETYQATVSPDFHPARRNVKFYDAKETSIRPLIPELEFIEDERYWGFKFRFGVFEINEHDFQLLKNKMLS